MTNTDLDYGEIQYRLQNHVVFRLFRKDRAALIISFLLEAFKKRHRSDIPQGELAAELAGHLAWVRMETSSEEPAPNPQRLLDEWADDGILRKYYTPGSDEARFDLTPEAEKALEWMRELTARQFVGAESRLLKIFDILKQIVFGASVDVGERVAELERKRAEIDAEMGRLKSGAVAPLNSTRIKEQYFELEDTARRLLADFKQIESNFRDLDRRARSEQIESDRSRGSVLHDFFELRDSIMASDQGRSFTAFWAFLMSAEKQEELAGLVQRVQALPDVSSLEKGYPLDLLKPHLVEAGARVQRMSHRINEELRYFLDERNRQEGRRVMELVETVRRLAIQVRDNPPAPRGFLGLEGDPEVDLVMERPLFTPQAPVDITVRPAEMGRPESDADALFDLDAVDLDALAERIRGLLRDRPQVTLGEVVATFPVTQGIAELLGYLTLASRNPADSAVGSTARVVVRNERTGRVYRVTSPDPIFLPEARQ
jgi:hypothetical protein